MKHFKKSILSVLTFASLMSPIAFNAVGSTDTVAMTENLDIFSVLFRELNTFYVDSINSKKSIETAINAMLDDIDPYTEYISAQDQMDFMAHTTGEYGGIGSYIMPLEDGYTYFSEPYEGSPAARAGILPGDKIIVIDGDSVHNLADSKVSAKLKGVAGSTVNITVGREYRPAGTDSIIRFSFPREKIKINPVPYYGVVRGDIGYISLTTFNEKSAQAVKEAVLEFKKNPEVKSIVLDLRGNGGGLLESAVQIVGYFVPKGTEVLQTRGKVKQNDRVYKTTHSPIDTEIPLAVFIDGSSASASEIVSGSLQDLDRAVIIGARSYGKGLVQSTRPLPGDALLKVTIAKYYIPSGRLIQAIDYSHREADGSVARTPDSLTHEFRTAHGRIVRDGGGITPDIKIDFKNNALKFNLVRKGWIMKYGAKYCAEHDNIGDAQSFVFTDEDFEDFKTFMANKNFSYNPVTESLLKNLRTAASSEGYLNDSTKVAFDQLEKAMKRDLNSDFDNNRDGIKALLAVEIQKHYNFQRGDAIESLKTDACMDSVESIMHTNGRYRQLLNK